jgi:uncharacterized membrane protein YvbJ
MNCSDCNEFNSETSKFCSSCGTELSKIQDASAQEPGEVLAAPHPDRAPASSLSISKFCSGCGSGLVATAAVCPKCGTPQNSLSSQIGNPAVFETSKSKTTAVLLAVFLSFWTWCYTYKKNASKFWIGLSVSVLLSWLYGLPIIAIWIWAIVDAATKPDSYYQAGT